MYARRLESEMFSEPKQHRFSPYESNEGSIVAIAGIDYAIIASDTRLSTGYSIYSRNQPKLFRLSNKTVLGSAGCWCVGRVYSYDSVGSKGTEKYIAAGSSSSLLQPLLDNQAAYKNIAGEKPPPLSLEKAVTLVHDVFTSAAERDIYTGDRVVMNIITKDGIKDMSFDLRKD
ncbi:proteasome subunit beta type-1 [Trichonephila inaurata madagascariensis]|uniref:Proteasome subunit beta type-1 n=1 Tax=Trichonephila inaurata madagascariensis TaxID=2747483 RepID=A0A8X6WRK9_9ARAC|nr:proteasome subunit beta type-1 [Trichonephila inaurata madagascariensis]